MSDIHSTVPILDRIGESVCAHKYNYSNEYELQDGIAQVLEVGWKKEYRLSQADRLDFFYEDSGVCVEVKIDGSLSDLIRQVHRYVQDDKIRGVLVVTPMVRLTRIPQTINNKPVRVVHLAKSTF